GPMCQGYRILHRADSLSPFSTVIDKGSEICGEQMNDQYKREIHTSPAQERTNYYVVQIDHPREQSAIIPVYVSAKGLSPMTIYPNPVYPPHTSVQLSVVPAKDMELFGYLYDRFGTRLETLDLRVTGGRTSL